MSKLESYLQFNKFFCFLFFTLFNYNPIIICKFLITIKKYFNCLFKLLSLIQTLTTDLDLLLDKSLF